MNQKPLALIGKSIFDFVGDKKAQEWKECLSNLNDTVKTDVGLTLPTSNEKKFFSAHVKNLIDDTIVQGVIIKLHDVTEARKREWELAESNLHFDQVFYKTTHDLKAPLRSVQGLISLAETADEKQQQQYISLIKRSILKLDNILEELDNFFNGNKLEVKHEKIDLKALISEEIDNLRNLNGTAKVQIELCVEQDVDFYSDRFRVRTIVTNLISNAIKYSDLEKENPYIQVKVSVSSNACALSVEDNGIGIELQYVDKIFDRFFRGTTAREGTGLGLYILKDTLQRLDGTINVTSVVGEGTKFEIVVPNQVTVPVL